MVAGPVPDETKHTLTGIVAENVIVGTTISTDGHYAYRDLGQYYQHETVNHDAKEYVRGNTTPTQSRAIGRC
jgi:hypothetical protein